ncbi:MAG: hypothetical protein QM654_07150 [Dysgonamonadaceae bacterium]
MNASVFKWMTMPDGHRANSIRPYNGQAMFLMFGVYDNDGMQIAGIR